jgi:hypothetical protein
MKELTLALIKLFVKVTLLFSLSHIKGKVALDTGTPALKVYLGM